MPLRRTLFLRLSAAALTLSLAFPADAADKTVTIGMSLSLTGADAQSAQKVKEGAQMAIEEANAQGGVAGYKINVVVLDDGTATAGQYDPAQAATNARKMVADATIVAAIGPQMSGAGKAMSPILSQGNLATVSPMSTNPDISDPKFAGQYRPKGKAIYFRTVTTDAYQGPNMANFYADTLKVKSLYVLDDSGAFGVGIGNSFEAQAKKRGIKLLGRDQLNPKETDYATILTKIKSLNADALYYGGVAQAGVKLAKQAHDIVPKMLKGGGDGLVSADFLKGAGFPAAEGWYVTIAAPHMLEDPQVKEWIERFRKKYGSAPEDYSITSYDAALVILDAIKRAAASGKEVDRDTVRDAIQTTKLKTLQGEVSFDENGDITNKVISVFKIAKDPAYPLDDLSRQLKYMGVAPQGS